jgi:glycosyltransferase involved in cell wall biosynthesis
MDSVQKQSFDAWEHIIVDDGSDDGTIEEVACRSQADPRIRYIRREGDKPGANVCRNIGIRESRADLIVFLDSDDLLAPECLDRRVAIIQRNADLDFALFQTNFFENVPGDLGQKFDPEFIGDDLLRFLFFDFPWIITGPVWRKASLLRLGLFDESLLSWQDIDLHVRALIAGCRYLRFPVVDNHVRWPAGTARTSVQQRRSPRHLEAAKEILVKFEQLVRDGPGMNWVRQRALCGLYFFVAEQWVCTGNLLAGLLFWREIRRRLLGPRILYLTGAAWLTMQSLGDPGRSVGTRLAHKWKGLVRMRTNPELIER